MSVLKRLVFMNRYIKCTCISMMLCVLSHLKRRIVWIILLFLLECCSVCIFTHCLQPASHTRQSNWFMEKRLIRMFIYTWSSEQWLKSTGYLDNWVQSVGMRLSVDEGSDKISYDHKYSLLHFKINYILSYLCQLFTNLKIN